MADKRTTHNKLSLVGMVFGSLSVVRGAPSKTLPCGDTKSRWICKCVCGNDVEVFGSALTSGNTKSCGCAQRRLTSIRNRTHGETGSRTYRIWQAMLNRCRNSKSINFHRYGGRGISVCLSWSDYESFVADMGLCPEGMSIDRIDNDGDYKPGNCRWSSRADQCRNKSTNRVITFKGRSMCLKDWAKELRIDQSSLRERLEKWPLEQALTQPKKGSNAHGINQ